MSESLGNFHLINNGFSHFAWQHGLAERGHGNWRKNRKCELISSPMNLHAWIYVFPWGCCANDNVTVPLNYLRCGSSTWHDSIVQINFGLTAMCVPHCLSSMKSSSDGRRTFRRRKSIFSSQSFSGWLFHVSTAVTLMQWVDYKFHSTTTERKRRNLALNRSDLWIIQRTCWWGHVLCWTLEVKTCILSWRWQERRQKRSEAPNVSIQSIPCQFQPQKDSPEPSDRHSKSKSDQNGFACNWKLDSIQFSFEL